ncbi:MAG: VWA domain-containing protein, partial [Rhodospirillaceae bacterium]
MEETPSLAPDPPQPDKPFAEGGLLAENILHFTRVLRRAGLPVGPGRTLEAVEAVRAVGVRNRTDFYWTLHAVFVHRRDQREIFDQAFHMFWRKPDFLERLYAMLLPTIGTAEHEQNAELSPRVADALRGDQEPPEDEEGADTPEQEDLPGQEIEVDATLTFSAQEVLAGKDFEKMTAAEFAEAKQAMARLVLPLEQVRTRRWRPDAAGSRPDP